MINKLFKIKLNVIKVIFRIRLINLKLLSKYLPNFSIIDTGHDDTDLYISNSLVEKGLAIHPPSSS